jgi:tRNA U34 2-thiouridine synthase MnmA/TrmU
MMWGARGCLVAPGAFLQNVEDAQFDRIASGHYARVEHAAINGDFVGARLLLSADQVVKHLVYLTTFPQISLSLLNSSFYWSA